MVNELGCTIMVQKYKIETYVFMKNNKTNATDRRRFGMVDISWKSYPKHQFDSCLLSLEMRWTREGY